MVEIDPANPDYRPRKHTALGRFRHENITMRGGWEKLVAYMGDDRRGAATLKFVSSGTVSSPMQGNSALFEDGILYVARYNSDGTGQWIPLELNATPIQLLRRFWPQWKLLHWVRLPGLFPLPKRNGIAGETTDGGLFNVETTNEATALPPYQGKKLSDSTPARVLCWLMPLSCHI